MKARRIRAFIEHFSLLSKHPPSADGLRHRVIVYFSGEDLEDIGDFEEMGREIEIENEIKIEFGGERAMFLVRSGSWQWQYSSYEFRVMSYVLGI